MTATPARPGASPPEPGSRAGQGEIDRGRVPVVGGLLPSAHVLVDRGSAEAVGCLGVTRSR